VSAVHDDTYPGIKAAELGQSDKTSWEGLILYGQNRMEEFRELIKASQERPTEGSFNLGIGLARLDGDEMVFEDMAVAYAVANGKSPPVWSHLQPKPEKQAETWHNLKVKSIHSDEVLEATIKMESPISLIIDLGQVTDLDMTGIELFNESLTGRIEGGSKTRFVNHERFVNSYFEKIRDSSASESVWDFLFNILKIAGNRTEFDRIAEVFREKSGKVRVWEDLSDPREREQDEIVQNVIRIGERLSELNAEFAKEIFKRADRPPKGSMMTVDFLNTVSCSLLDIWAVHGFLKAMNAEKIDLHFINVNEIICAALNAFGVEKFAKISPPGAIS
jgi:anti-anti-sigma regulatory factor